jgi:alkanesulfonate monooxygenase SsuD/methylene tetrahydromethanopterin reductase-like flavin-dependent oxidoreductase (luciferase family)
VIYPNLAVGQKQYGEFKEYLASSGRDPASVRVAPAVYAVVGATKSEAEDKRARLDALAKPIDGLVLLSEVLNFDFASKGYDDPFTAEEMDSISGIQAFRDRVVMLSGRTSPTVRDFVEFTKRGSLSEFPIFMGDPKTIADDMEQWFGTACDGFVLAGTHVPDAYDDFVRLVIPELQRRGLFRTEYQGTTLRQNLGLKVHATRGGQ